MGHLPQRYTQNLHYYGLPQQNMMYPTHGINQWMGDPNTTVQMAPMPGVPTTYRSTQLSGLNHSLHRAQQPYVNNPQAQQVAGQPIFVQPTFRGQGQSEQQQRERRIPSMSISNPPSYYEGPTKSPQPEKPLKGKEGGTSGGASAPVAATQSPEIKKTEVMNAPIEDPISPVEGEEQLDPYRNTHELASPSVEGEELNSGTSNQDVEDLTCLFWLAMRINHECSSLFIIVINLIFMFLL